MKIYFAASVRGYERFTDEYKAVMDNLEATKHHVTFTSFNKDEVKEFYNKLEKGGSSAYNDYFNNTIESLKKSDINVFECTLPSLGIGFQIEKSLEFNKPTIVLYLKDHIPHFIAGTKNEKMLLHEYSTSTVGQVVNRAIEEAKHLADKRFNFFISPGLLTYLENASKKEGITKSTFIRNLILKHQRQSK